ncbi:MAG: hypothetical protein LBR93_09260 [Treponema sp.]|jgi:hypothetical protein|nr:hypothetical protein [Treponema sp.]
MKKIALLYLSVFCFFSWFLMGCSSTPKILISTLDEIRQRRDPSKNLIVVFKEIPGLVRIATNENIIFELDESEDSVAIINSLYENELISSDPKRRARGLSLRNAALSATYSRMLSYLYYSSSVLLGALYTDTYSDIAAFNLTSSDQMRIFVDGTTDNGNIRNYRWKVLTIDIKPDINEQFYVIEDKGTYMVREITDVSELTSLFLEKRWYPQSAPDTQKGFIVFE